MMELLSKAVTVAMLSFVVSSMLAMGMALSVSDFGAAAQCPAGRARSARQFRVDALLRVRLG